MMDRLRQQLDFNYHGMYSASRESLQHKIAESILNSDGLQLLRDNSLNKLTPSAQWMIMTAGPMGVGKSTVINWLASHGHLPFEVASCVSIDIDAIREILPESREMKEYQPEVYGSRTQKEAGLIAELAVLAALEAQKHVVVDSSMLSIKWQRDNILYLKDKHPGLKVLLLHVTAPEDIIHQRISRRQQRDGRIIPTEVLQKSIKVSTQST